VVIDAGQDRLESIPEDLARPGLHWFRVVFDSGSGRCGITTAEAQRLRQLNTDWVRRALLNLASRYGRPWLEDALRSRPGLLLRHSDASEPREGRGASESRLVRRDQQLRGNA